MCVHYCGAPILAWYQWWFSGVQLGLTLGVPARSIGRVDAPLNDHLERNDVMYLQIATRWMNCLLMRELSLAAIIRLWVTFKPTFRLSTPS